MRQRALSLQVLCRIVLLAGIAALLLHGSRTAQAQPTFFANRTQIKACVLVSTYAFNDTQAPRNIDPHLFYIMDSRTDIKPGDWEFVNPLAPSNLTAAQYLRWKQRGANHNGDPAVPASGPVAAFQVNVPLTKNMGAYWEVNLSDISDDDLRQFDVVFLALNGTINIWTPAERARLLRYVDGGGTLWLENEGGAAGSLGNPVGGFFDVTFGGSGLPSSPVPVHPLFSSPFVLDSGDFYALSQISSITQSFTAATLPSALLIPVLPPLSTGNAVVSAGDYGAGHIVVTSLQLANAITGNISGTYTKQVDGSTNSGAISGDAIYDPNAGSGQDVRPAALRLAYNIAGWANRGAALNSNVRRGGGSAFGTGRALTPDWTFNSQTQSATPGSGAIAYKGIVYWVDQNGTLDAFSQKPGSDLFGDGNTDQGQYDVPLSYADFIKGSPYDQLWQIPFPTRGSRYSSPVAFSFTDISGIVHDIVAYTSDTGITSLQEVTSNGKPPRHASIAAGGFAPVRLTGREIPSPTYSDGVLFCAVYQQGANPASPDANWRITAIDVVKTLANVGSGSPGITSFGTPPNGAMVPPFLTLNNQYVDGMTSISGSLTVGYVQDQAGGGTDKMIYAPVDPYVPPAATTPAQSVVRGFWYSTKNEPLVAKDPTDRTIYYSSLQERRRIPWYIPGAGEPDYVQPHIRKITTDAVTGLVSGVTDVIIAAVPTGNNPALSYSGGTPNMMITFGQAQDPNVTFVADFVVDWSLANIGNYPAQGQTFRPEEVRLFSSSRRFDIQMPLMTTPPTPGSGPYNYITGNIALTGQDTAIFNTFLTDLAPSSMPMFPPNDLMPPPALPMLSPAAVPSRTYAVRQQNNDGNPPTGTATVARAGNGSQVAWMFAPVGNGLPASSTGLAAPAARLTNADSFGPAGLTATSNGSMDTFRAIGTPAVVNNTVYVVGYGALSSGGNATVVLALRANPTMSFTVNPPITAPIGSPAGTLPPTPRVSQYNPTNPDKVILLPANASPPNYYYDPDLGTITIVNCQVGGQPGNPSGNSDVINTAIPLIVSDPNDPINTGGVPQVDKNTGRSVLDNVLWYMLIPDDTNGNLLPANLRDIKPASGASVSGNSLYFGTQDGSLVTVDLRDDSGGNQVALFSNGTPRVRKTTIRAIPTNAAGNYPRLPAMVYPPTIAQDGVIAGGPNTVTVLTNRATLIADANRLIEVDYGGNAVWTLAGTRDLGSTGQTTGQNVSQQTATVTSFSHPSTARRVGSSSYLIADTGNNRVVECNRGGTVLWELRSFNNDCHIIPAGSPLTLNTPTDVQVFTDDNVNQYTSTDPVFPFTNASGTTYTVPANTKYTAVHYLIADSGNYRLIEVVDVYDSNGKFLSIADPNPSNAGNSIVMRRQVVFVSRSLSEQNSRLRYRTIQRFVDRSSAKNAAGKLPVYLLSIVDNISPSALDPDSRAIGGGNNNQEGLGGGVVVIQRDPAKTFLTRSSRVITDGSVKSVITSFLVQTTSPANTIILSRQAISNPTYFREFDYTPPSNANNASPHPRYLLADANGCYELDPTDTVGGRNVDGDPVVEWRLTTDDYRNMTGRPLRAASVQRLTQADRVNPVGITDWKPRYLITNSYSGPDFLKQQTQFQGGNPDTSQIRGEVFEIRGIDYDTTIAGYYHDKLPYNDPLNIGIPLYRVNTSTTPASIDFNVNSPIVWMSPSEAIAPVKDSNGNVVSYQVQRAIGTSDAATSTALLEQPQFSERSN